MKIGVVGTGAVGGYFGGLLQRVGNEVVFLARGRNFEVMKKDGLLIISEKESFKVHQYFTDQLSYFRDVDLALICLKSNTTKEVAEKLLPILKKDAWLLTLQNGVDNEEVLSDIFGANRVISAAVYIQASVLKEGVVKQIGRPPRLVIGAVDVRNQDVAEEIASLFNKANIQTFVSEHIMEVKWKKLLWNVTFNPLSALLKISVGNILEHPQLYQTAQTICKEAISVAQQVGMKIDDNFTKEILERGNFAKDHKTSMLQDRLRGKRMEIESICGHIVKKGKEFQVETPVLETIYRLLKYIDSSTS
jgi:2-dehydropantoate 2-reductase